MPEQSEKINVAVVGAGRMGGHHVRTYRNLSQANLLAVVDPDQDRARQLAKAYDCDVCEDVDQLYTRYPQVQAVTVAVPTVRHMAVATALISHGIACLVEKPLAPTPDEAQHLAELAAQSKVVLQVGHTERFNPAVRAVCAMNLKPRFMEVSRISPMTFRSLDIGVVMDMMIHDLDIVLALVRSPLKHVDAVGVAVIADHEDICNARLTFESGCVANLTASRMAMQTQRRMKLFSRQAYVDLDYQTRSGIVVRLDSHEDQLQTIRHQLSQGEDLSGMDYANLVSTETLSMDLSAGQEDPLTAQLLSFLHAVQTGTRPVVDGLAGCAAVQAAHQVVAAVNKHQWRD